MPRRHPAQHSRVAKLPDQRRGRHRGGGESPDPHLPGSAPTRSAPSRPRPPAQSPAKPHQPCPERTTAPCQPRTAAPTLQQPEPEDPLSSPQGRGWGSTSPSSPSLGPESPVDWRRINRGADQVSSAIDRAKGKIDHQQQQRQQQKSMLTRLKSHLGEGSYWKQQQQQQSSDFSTTAARRGGHTVKRTTHESNYPAAAAGQGSGPANQPASQLAQQPASQLAPELGTPRRGPPREAKAAGPAWLKALRKAKQ